MTTIQLAGNGIGGTIQGNYGTYVMASDGTFTVDTRDAPSLLTLGATYVGKNLRSYSFPAAPIAAAAGQIVASHALSNGTVSVSNQPDVPRVGQVIVGAGAAAMTAGQLAVTYLGNDGQSHVDTFSAILGSGASSTTLMSFGVNSVTSVVVSGIVGGSSPFFKINTTTGLAVPLNPNSVDFTPIQEFDDGVAAGTVGVTIASVFGGFTPAITPNGTHTVSLAYSSISPNS